MPDQNAACTLMKVGPVMTAISLAAWLMTGMDNPTTELPGLICLWMGTSGAAITLAGAAEHLFDRRKDRDVQPRTPENPAGPSPGRIYMVGGSVRDSQLGMAGKVMDLTVVGDASKVAREFAQATGGECTPHERFGTVTVRLGQQSNDFITARSETYLTPGALPVMGRALDRAKRTLTPVGMNRAEQEPAPTNRCKPYTGRDQPCTTISRSAPQQQALHWVGTNPGLSHPAPRPPRRPRTHGAPPCSNPRATGGYPEQKAPHHAHSQPPIAGRWSQERSPSATPRRRHPETRGHEPERKGNRPGIRPANDPQEMKRCRATHGSGTGCPQDTTRP